MTGGMPHFYHTEVPADRAASCPGQSPGQVCLCSLAPVSLCVRRLAFLALLGLNLKATDGEKWRHPSSPDYFFASNNESSELCVLRIDEPEVPGVSPEVMWRPTAGVYNRMVSRDPETQGLSLTAHLPPPSPSTAEAEIWGDSLSGMGTSKSAL